MSTTARPCPLPPGHGTGNPTEYNRGCRCPDTKEAFNAYRRAMRRADGYGRRQRQVYVDAAPVREKFQAMRARGLSNEHIGKVCGVSGSTVSDHLDRGGRPTVRAATAEKVAAAPMPLRPGQRSDWVASIGAARRLRALTALGWGLARMSEQSGVHRSQLAGLRGGLHPRVHIDTHHTVAALYDRLWNAQPPRTTQPERTAATQAAIYAADQGWLPPMAWDDHGLDDPGYTPDVGALRTDQPSAADRLASLIELLDLGLDSDTAAKRAGYGRTDSAETALRRSGRSITEWPQCRLTAA